MDSATATRGPSPSAGRSFHLIQLISVTGPKLVEGLADDEGRLHQFVFSPRPPDLSDQVAQRRAQETQPQSIRGLAVAVLHVDGERHDRPRRAIPALIWPMPTVPHGCEIFGNFSMA